MSKKEAKSGIDSKPYEPGQFFQEMCQKSYMRGFLLNYAFWQKKGRGTKKSRGNYEKWKKRKNVLAPIVFKIQCSE